MEKNSLLKTLLAIGIGSRRYLADAIRQRRIKINGETVDNFAYILNPDIDTVTIDDQPVSIIPEKRFILILNKPKDVLSTTRDERGRKTVISILPKKYQGLKLYPIGRLDKDTTGLLLITNDGNLTYQLTHPKFEHKKEYLLQIESSLNENDLKAIQSGINLDDGITYPAVIERSQESPPYNYSITIHEGRKRQLHRMFEKLGYRILALKRIRIGNLYLGSLEEGKVRHLSDSEIDSLLQ